VARLRLPKPINVDAKHTMDLYIFENNKPNEKAAVSVA